ncbi:MAG: histidine ammonia-lyase [Planctomycetes bacterium]|nr:histidine ammonia-lyase [Planctomycetota bacterium]
MKKLTLEGKAPAFDALLPLVRGEALELALAPAARKAVQRARRIVDTHVDAGDVVYGLTTGFGKLKNVSIPRQELVELQRNLVLSHACGVGEPLSIEVVRIAQVLRLVGLVRGHSGVSLEVVEKLVRFFNAGFVPVVPEKGSVGASGDLSPLAHMAACYMGHGEVFVGGKRMSAKAALKRVGETPLELGAKEGLALINGTEIIKALGVVALAKAVNVSKAADAVAALSIEALLGSVKPFGERFVELKCGNRGHARTSQNIRACLAQSQVLASHADCGRVQDPYSLRCVPQIHGAFKTALEHVLGVVELELGTVTDNPIVFADTGEVVSAGLFHGQPLSIPLDYLALATATLGNVSERRIEQLVNPDLSGLPAFLTPKPGLNSGMMIVQVAAAALASENKSLAHPASVDTIPTSANQEDHVSMGPIAARHALAVIDNVESILAMEWLCAAQAREFHSELRAGKGAEAAHKLLRTQVKPLATDRYLHDDIEAARALLRDGSLVAAVEKAAGRLES